MESSWKDGRNWDAPEAKYFLSDHRARLHGELGLRDSGFRRVLDIGTGKNLDVLDFYQDAESLCVLDVWTGFREHFTPYAGARPVDILVADMHELHLPAASFDLVTAFKVVDHGTARQWRKLLHRVHAALSVDGVFAFSVPTGIVRSVEDGVVFFGSDPRRWQARGRLHACPMDPPEEGVLHLRFSELAVDKVIGRFKMMRCVRLDDGNTLFVLANSSC